MKRKFFASIIAGVMAFVCALPLVGAVKASANDTTAPQNLDMYLIAGQSNASGYSRAGSNLTETFDNVWYAGQTEKVVCGSDTNPPKTNSDFITNGNYTKFVSSGMGSSGSYIGPEYGMAKALNNYYTGDDTKAFIFKTAAGGTFLLDNGSGLSGNYGNWYPRSLWPDGYTPNIETASSSNDATGILYQLFVENFKTVYNKLKADGYNPVVKGMVWMQGESDLPGISDTYGDTLKAFINDIRADLVQITGDNAVQAMPFVIGKIAPSFQGWWNKADGPANMAEMHRQQERMVTELGGVKTVSTDDLIIVNKTADGGNIVGSDESHFNSNDMVTLGQRFGNAVRELMGSTLIAPVAQNGNISYEMINDTTVKFTMSPASSRYQFASFKVNGQDVTESVVNGENGLEYTLENASGTVVAEATFTEVEKFEITYEEIANKAGFQFTYKTMYKGDTLSLKAYANLGYEVVKVKFNGNDMTFNSETGEWEVVITEAGTVTLEISGNGVATETPEKPELPSYDFGDGEQVGGTEEGGCGSIIVANSLVISLGAIACGLLISKKREK